MTLEMHSAVTGALPAPTAGGLVWQIVFYNDGATAADVTLGGQKVAEVITKGNYAFPPIPPGQVGSLDPTKLSTSAAMNVTYILNQIA